MSTFLNTLDAAADTVTVVTPAAKPIVRLMSSFTPHAHLKRGDELQASTWTILEETEGIMDTDIHNDLQYRYDLLLGTRQELDSVGFLQSLKSSQRKKMSMYASNAGRLNKNTVTSSQLARTKHMWGRKQSRNNSNTSDGVAHGTGGASDETHCRQEGAEDHNCTHCSTRTARTGELEHQVSTDTLDISEENPFRETASVIVSPADWHEDPLDTESVYSQTDDVSVYVSRSSAHSYPPSLRIDQNAE